MKKIFFVFVLVVFVFLGCKTIPKVTVEPSINLSDVGIKTAEQLVNFFMKENPEGDREKVQRLAKFYIEECKIEGINSDCAFVQMCLETGFLRFGNLVTEDMNNFCGLGAIDSNQRGLVFKTEQEGVRAHVQHLHAYATTKELKNPCIDTRYKYVKPRGKAPTVLELAGTWAMDKEYGNKLQGMLKRL